MPHFSQNSKRRLATCHQLLQDIFNEVIRHYDCTILCGHRGRAEQNRVYAIGKSRVAYPDSKHNQVPSMAVDAVPYPVDWSDTDRMYFFAGLVTGIARTYGIPLRWGGDWDSDTDLHDQDFMDLVHFELIAEDLEYTRLSGDNQGAIPF